MLPRLYTPEETAQALRIAVKAVHWLCRQGKLDFVKINGKERRFTPEQVQAYVDAQTVSKSVIDKKPTKPLPYAPKKGGAKSDKGLVKAQLHEEIKQWL
jgi:excisionase family DNA binding protein